MCIYRLNGRERGGDEREEGFFVCLYNWTEGFNSRGETRHYGLEHSFPMRNHFWKFSNFFLCFWIVTKKNSYDLGSL